MNPSLQLNDIILPPAPGIWPLAPGWWALIITALLVITALAWFIRHRRYRKKQQLPYRRAQQTLQQLAEQSSTLCPELIADINQSLKIWCRYRYPGALPLYGREWAVFLSQKANTLTKEQLKLLGAGAYVSAEKLNGPANELLLAVQLWLEKSEQQWRPVVMENLSAGVMAE